MAVDGSSYIVAVITVNHALNVEVCHADDTIGRKERCERIDDRIVLWDHRERVRHGDELRTFLVLAVWRVPRRSDLSRQDVVVVLETKMACILTYDLDILPAEPFESITGDLAERWREVDEEDLAEERRHVHEVTHCLDVVAGAPANLKLTPEVSIELYPQVILSKLTSTQMGFEGTVPESTLCLICAATRPSMSSRPCSSLERVASYTDACVL